MSPLAGSSPSLLRTDVKRSFVNVDSSFELKRAHLSAPGQLGNLHSQSSVPWQCQATRASLWPYTYVLCDSVQVPAGQAFLGPVTRKGDATTCATLKIDKSCTAHSSEFLGNVAACDRVDEDGRSHTRLCTSYLRQAKLTPEAATIGVRKLRFLHWRRTRGRRGGDHRASWKPQIRGGISQPRSCQAAMR